MVYQSTYQTDKDTAEINDGGSYNVNIYHVVPTRDNPAHRLSSQCWCQPDLIGITQDSETWNHHIFS